MSQVRANGIEKSRRRKPAAGTPSREIAEAEVELDARVDRAIETIKETFGEVTQNRPALAVAAGAGVIGFGAGVLLGSRLARFLVVSTVSSIVRDAVGTEIRKTAVRLFEDLRGGADEGEAPPASTAAVGEAE